MVLSLSLLAVALAVAATADSAAQPANHEWPEQVYGNINGREKRQIAEGGKHHAIAPRKHRAMLAMLLSMATGPFKPVSWNTGSG